MGQGYRTVPAVVAGLALWLLPVGTAGAQAPPAGPPVVPPSASPPTPIGTVGPSTPVLHFAGALDNPTPLPLVNEPVPLACAAECREFRFTAATSAPFLVAVKNTVTGPKGTFNPNDGFDLYLYGPSGTLVGAQNGIGANGQALSVSVPSPGAYTIVVTFTYAEDSNAAYDGEVRLMVPSAWQPPPATCGLTVSGVRGCFELPAMRALPAYDLAVGGLPPVASTPLGFPFPVNLPTSGSCYTDESYGLDNPSPSTLAHPATRCLRFTSDVQDVGAGALEVRLPWLAAGGQAGAPQSGFVPGQCRAEQVISSTKGQTVTRPAGACEFHPEHGHFHYRDLIAFTLYRPAANGGIGAKVAKSLKESFCLTDDDFFGFGTKGPDGPRNFVGQPGCNLPADSGPPASSQGAGPAAGAFVLEGISPGWGDVYTWDTPDQYIDITGLRAGTYDLVEETNPNGALLVSGPARTCALTQLRLTSTSVSTISVEASVPCPST